jgi:very-short-patch-repair endonuclease
MSGAQKYPLFRASDVCAILELDKNVSQALARLDDDEKEHIKSNDAGGRQQLIWFINESGIIKLLQSTRKTVPDYLLTFLSTNFGISLNRIYTTKESENIDIIQLALSFWRSKTQYPIGNYRVDLCFYEKRIIVECDEKNHEYYNIDYEIKREQDLKILGYKIYRFNPDKNNHNIGRIISTILSNELLSSI